MLLFKRLVADNGVAIKRSLPPRYLDADPVEGDHAGTTGLGLYGALFNVPTAVGLNGNRKSLGDHARRLGKQAEA